MFHTRAGADVRCQNQRCHNKKTQAGNDTGDVNDVMLGSAEDIGI